MGVTTFSKCSGHMLFIGDIKSSKAKRQLLEHAFHRMSDFVDEYEMIMMQ